MYRHQETTFTLPKLPKKWHNALTSAGVELDPWKDWDASTFCVFRISDEVRAEQISHFLQTLAIPHTKEVSYSFPP